MKASTPINISELKSQLLNHPDTEYVNHLLSGLSKGFNTGFSYLPSSNFICHNLQNALKQPTIVTELLEKELSKGYIIGPFDVPPFPSYRINPIGLAERKYSKKYRLVVDLSAPHNNSDHSSMNDLIDKPSFSVKYVKIDDAISTIRRLGQGAILNKTDIVDAFKLIPISPDLWCYHGIKWKDKYYFFVRLCFGSRSSPKLFTLLSEAVHFIATKNFQIGDLLFLLDDFLSITRPHSDGHATMSTLQQVFKVLNIPIHPDKTLGPSTNLTFLGIDLDSVLMQASLPSEKVARVQEIIHSFLHRNSLTKVELQCLLGHLNYASRVILQGRSFVSYLLSLLSTAKHQFHHVKLSLACRRDLNMWLEFLKCWNGVSFFYDVDITNSADLNLYTDASGSLGYGGYFNGKWFYASWPKHIQLGCDEISIAFMELVPIVACTVLWGSHWSNKRILFHCDNLSVVNIINKGRSHSPKIMNLMRRLTWCSVINNFTLHATHIAGKQNIISDCLSRLQIDKFRRLVPLADKYPTIPPPLERLYLV